ncbi:MAG TPA: AAA family ATPase [Solirubrobacteraceae bacterium]|nr:AAA family ATPase [Solirubrobacteraceae bacterium]
MSTTRGLGFLGRTRERERLDAMLAQARDGRSAVVVIRGDPGIGKTALLRYAARQASGLRTTEVEGIQAEMELPFAGIHRLCSPMLGGVEALAEPQQHAIRVALGVSSGNSPDRFLIAVAVLNLLSASAEERPLLCLVDDAQWLDAASVEILGFVARRLAAEPIAMIFALREPIATRALDGLPQLSLGGLDEPDARALLSRAVAGRLDDGVRDRIIAETAGNPLALMELSDSMSPSERAGGYAAPATSDVPSRLAARYLQRVAALPERTRRLMLLAAAEPLGDAMLLWRAAERLSTDPGALTPASEAGLLEIDDRVRFHHPLVRSAVYGAATPEELRRVHDALAEVSDPKLAADRRAWHRALAAAEPDEDVAADLEHSAGRAERRGGLAAAAAFLERATALTPDPALQAERALAAAAVSLQAGEFDAAQRLLAIAESGSLDGFGRARATLLRGHAALASRYGTEAAPLLLEAAKQLEPFDLSLARRAYLTAWHAAAAANYLGGTSVLLEVGRAVCALPPLPPDPHPLDLVIEGFAVLVTDGHADAMPILRRAANESLRLPVEDVVRWGAHVGGVGLAMWADDSVAVFERQARIVRDAGALGELPIHLQALALDRSWRGDLAGAQRLAAEAESIATSTGNQVPPFALLRILSLQGREAEASRLIEAVIEEGTTQGQGNAVMTAFWGAAVLYNGLGRYEDAAAASREVVLKGIYPLLTMWALFELIEASLRVGDTRVASDALDELAATTQPAGSGFARGIEARCRALITDDDDAEASYHEAIEELDRAGIRTELARAQLVYGEWLRREGRLGEARERLRAAEKMFAQIGMMGFAERAQGELAAAGAKLRKRPVEVHEDLTPQEEQIARLARDGLTNTQIGTQLFLSSRTIEWHLHKVFSKLGIDSRTELPAALPSQGRDGRGSRSHANSPDG